MNIYWDIVELPGVKVIPSKRFRKIVEKLLKALDDGLIDFVDLVKVSQYDLSSTKKSRGDVSSSINRISRATKADRRDILKETSSSYMFVTAVFYAIKDLDRESKLQFLIEPRLEPGSYTYDYAIYDPVEGRLKVVAEVKRLRSLANIGEYLETFMNKTEKCLATESIHRIALHIHLTPEILEKYQGVEELLLGLGKDIQLSKCKLTLITSSGDTLDEFMRILGNQIQHLI
ncbi:hypothetical protein Igag_0775 [Ignisphaera aggregans DSM 17230]|uniref:Uncharacterized protein n=1 Tax=Ignisphaera aggregans (strain DSM 17230 / JCM 13409 / AQ1.S1) TaxID=583356 RepID=E0STC5_IGNAA|nr:hypothetical protein Igag_0775 [Ignisphaera aggregans DSM 17230]